MEKYIIRRWTEHFREERANSFWDALQVRRRLMEEEPGYCHIIKVPFRKRHPDFPIWFSLASLLLVAIARALD